MGVIIDTSFLVALNNSKDLNHQGALALKAIITNKELGQPCISDYIFDEFVTFIRARNLPDNVIKEIGNALLMDADLQRLDVDASVFEASWELFKKVNTLSFTDCTTASLAKKFKIANIASYDSGFDILNFARRVT